VRLRHVATLNPPVQGLDSRDGEATVSFLPLDKIWADERFDPTNEIRFKVTSARTTQSQKATCCCLRWRRRSGRAA